jgi:hypothetical protein
MFVCIQNIPIFADLFNEGLLVFRAVRKRERSDTFLAFYESKETCKKQHMPM